MRRTYVLRRMLAVAIVVLVVGGIAAGGYFAGRALFGPESSTRAVTPPAPNVVVRKITPTEPQELGFPDFATNNTTRVAGADPTADAAGVALAVHPSTGGVPAPSAVTLVSASDWQGGIAAAALTAAPIGAPILVSGSGADASLTASALRSLAPTGSATARTRTFTVGPVQVAPGKGTERVAGNAPASTAAALARLRERLTGKKPAHIVIASSTQPAYAMPAAAWAARSGDPVLFAGRDAVPADTLRVIHRYAGVPVYVLGPPTVISDRALALIRKVAPSAKRVGGPGVVANSVDFARYSNGSFGWDLNDPGHGFVIANADRPLDAAAAAALSASGTWGALLVTDDARSVPPDLESYLLDLKPGYADDPTRAVYNHVWLIGSSAAISVPFQARIDQLAEVAKVRSGR